MSGLINSFKGLVRPRSITLDASSITIEETKTYQLTATIAPENAINKNITWITSNSNVAIVNENGLVTATGEGNCIITVKTQDRGYTYECECEVWVVRITTFELNKSSTTIEYSHTEQLNLTIGPEGYTYKGVTRSSSDTSVATVTQNGLITATGEGNCTITATSDDGVHSDSCSVSVRQQHVTSVTLNTNTLNGFIGKTAQLTATINPSDATIKTVTWSSSNTSIATVSSSGLVTYKGAGSCTITVTTTDGGKTAMCSVTSKTPIDVCFGYTGAEQTRTVTETGCYCVEVWGAQGGTVSSCLGGFGGYAAGKIQLTSGCVLYIYVGGQPATCTTKGGYTSGWNGGGQARVSCYSGTRTYPQGGGGGTDVRYNGNTICHRFIVAGGGAGATCGNCGSVNLGASGAGGGACGCSPCGAAWVGCQTAAGCRGSFGQGASGGTVCNYKHQGGGGGGGWYGGGASGSYSDSSSGYAPQVGGGSGYTYTSSTCGNHPYKACLGNLSLMTSAICCPGSGTMPTPSGGSQTGRCGNGCVRIRGI